MSLDGSILPPGVLFQDRHRFTGMDVLVVSDDDKRMQDVPEDCIGTDGSRIYVRKTLWPRVRYQLIQVTSPMSVRNRAGMPANSPIDIVETIAP